jgi:hypothetical protein
MLLRIRQEFDDETVELLLEVSSNARPLCLIPAYGAPHVRGRQRPDD